MLHTLVRTAAKYQASGDSAPFWTPKQRTASCARSWEWCSEYAVAVTERETVDRLVDFVSGRMSVADFERVLYADPRFEATLSDDPDLPPGSYVGRSNHLYLIQLDSRTRATCSTRRARCRPGSRGTV